jgi:transcriptional regulator with XRE-family HTH domain
MRRSFSLQAECEDEVSGVISAIPSEVMDSSAGVSIVDAMSVSTFAPTFGDALRAWRQSRGMSQLDLALAAGASPRHVSFLETNRAKPSRDMVLTLADAMVVPRASRNALLNAAGYAPLYPSTPLDDETLAPLRALLSEMMARHVPNPAMLCDRYWSILDANATARVLLAPLHGANGEMNVVRMLTESPLELWRSAGRDDRPHSSGSAGSGRRSRVC